MIDVDVAVIGGGPAGIAAAIEAARGGLAVALFEAGGVGGRASWGTLLPWRALERAADAGGTFAEAQAEARRLAERWEERQALRLEDAGVEVVRARARFTSPCTLELDDGREATFEQAIVASGARARTLAGDAPDGRRLLRPDDFLSLPSLPDRLMVIGGGAAAAELVDAVSRLSPRREGGGTELTWVMDEVGLLPRFDRELAEAFGDVVMERGVKLVHGKAVVSLALAEGGVEALLDGGRRYAAAVAVLAVGSAPRLDDLGLEAAGLDEVPVGGALAVDARCRVAPHLLAAGECTGLAASAAAAEAMGRCAGRVAAGSTLATYDPSRVPLVARTRPLLAQVGETPEQVVGREVIFHTLRLEETLGGLLAGLGETHEAKGLLRLVCDSDSGAVLGATALGPGAPEVASAVALALGVGATDEQLADVFAAVPGVLDGLVRAPR